MSTEDTLPSTTGDLYRIQVRLDSERQLGPISQSIAPSSSERRFLTIVEGSTTVRQLRDKIIKHIKRNYPDVSSSLKVEGLQNSQCYDLDIRFLVKEVLDRLDTVIVVSNSGLPQRKKPGPKPKGSAPAPASQSTSSVASTTSEKPKAAETSAPAKKPTEVLKRKLDSSSDSSSSSSSSSSGSDDGSASPAKKAKKDVKPAAAPTPAAVPTPEATPASPAGDGKKKKKKKQQQQQATGDATTSVSSEPAKKAPVKETPAKEAPVKEAPAAVNKKQKKKGPEAKKPEVEAAKEKPAVTAAAAAAPKKENSKKDNSSDDKENHYLSKEERQKRLETLTSKDPKELSQEEKHEFEDLKKRQAAYQRQRDRRAAKAMASEALLNKDPSLAAKAAEILEHRKPGPKPKQKAQQE